MTSYWCERAWLGPGEVVDGLVVDVSGTHIEAIRRSQQPPGHAVRLPGLTLPGFADTHSHAFHRALRGRTQRGHGSFWTWRDTMYDVASRLDPDSYFALASATYQELALGGVTAVGEFHYLHHDAEGHPYTEPNAMGEAVIAAARGAGLRITLLDTCYLAAGFWMPPEGVQRRFTDSSAERWAERVSLLDHAADPGVVIAAAIHSVRAVPRSQLNQVATALPQTPVHVHVSEQPAENAACLEATGCTPTELLAAEGALSDRLSAVHATHLTDHDVRLLAEARCCVAFCPTTERDLADGIGQSRTLADAGITLTLGSDSHAVVDMFEEMRAVELDERLRTRKRGHWRAGDLLEVATGNGHASLGFADAGRLAPGQWADLVTVSVHSPRTAGSGGSEETAVFSATAADVTSVVASGRRIELDAAQVGRNLEGAISAVWGAT